MENKRTRVIISGIVQGVFFRDHTRRRAQELGLTGWVKNNFNGTVEAVFEGPSHSVDAMTNWCYDGPASAVINDVKRIDDAYTGEFSDFSIIA
ncbi:acylphosphatase [Thermoproteota archaeon]